MKRHLVEGRRMETNSLRNEDKYTATPSDVLIQRSKDSRDTLLSWKGHSAKITTYDISAVNGVIHVIDQVLFDKDIDLSAVSGGCAIRLNWSSLLFRVLVIVLSFLSLSV